MSQLLSQVGVIFLLMLLGALIRKSGFLHEESITDVTNIALYFLSPLVIIKAFEQEFSAQRMVLLLKVIGLVFLTYIITIFMANLIFKSVADKNLKRIALYGSVYSNNGFMGVPLALGLFGSQGVFYSVASLIGFNILSWTHGLGIFRISEPKSWQQQLKQICLNPNIIAIILGFLVFINSYHFPSVLESFINYASASFTPISMMVIGSNLVNVRINDLKLAPSLWLSLFLRNILFPIVGIVLLRLAGISGVALYTTVILSACPVAGLVVLFTLQAKGDARPATVLMSLSTILSLVTIPLIFFISKLF